MTDKTGGAAAAPRTDPQTAAGRAFLDEGRTDDPNHFRWSGPASLASFAILAIEAEAGAAESGASPAAEDRKKQIETTVDSIVERYGGDLNALAQSDTEDRGLAALRDATADLVMRAEELLLRPTGELYGRDVDLLQHAVNVIHPLLAALPHGEPARTPQPAEDSKP